SGVLVKGCCLLGGFFHQLKAQTANGAHGVEDFRANPRAVTDAVTAEQAEWVLQTFEALDAGAITAVQHKTQSLQEGGRAAVFFRVPPPRWALRGAAAAENTLIKAVQ